MIRVKSPQTHMTLLNTKYWIYEYNTVIWCFNIHHDKGHFWGFIIHPSVFCYKHSTGILNCSLFYRWLKFRRWWNSRDKSRGSASLTNVWPLRSLNWSTGKRVWRVPRGECCWYSHQVKNQIRHELCLLYVTSSRRCFLSHVTQVRWNKLFFL